MKQCLDDHFTLAGQRLKVGWGRGETLPEIFSLGLFAIYQYLPKSYKTDDKEMPEKCPILSHKHYTNIGQHPSCKRRRKDPVRQKSSCLILLQIRNTLHEDTTASQGLGCKGRREFKLEGFIIYCGKEERAHNVSMRRYLLCKELPKVSYGDNHPILCVKYQK